MPETKYRDRGQEDDEEDEESDEEEEDDNKNGTRQAIVDMKTKFNGQATEETVERFLDDHSAVVKNVSQSGETFFHRIIDLVHRRADENSLNALDIRPLFERLVKSHSYLLRITDEDDQTPLYRAINRKRFTWKLVNYVLDSCKDPACIDDVLKRTCGKGESLKTCLTLAFEKDLNNKVLLNLVRNASPTVLDLTDGSHRTPFHYAVQYEQCTDERVEIIRLLLERDSEIVQEQKLSGTSRPIETFLDHKYARKEEGRQTPVEYSVYGEHKRTEKAYLDLLDKERATKMRETENEKADTKPKGSSLAHREKEPPKSGLLPPKEAKTQIGGDRDRGPKRIGLDRENPKQYLDPKLDETERRLQELREKEGREQQERNAREEKHQQEKITERDGSRSIQFRDPKERLDETGKLQFSLIAADPAPNTPLKRVGTHRSDTADMDKKEKKKSSSRRASKKPDPKVLATNSVKVLRMLKLHYMRTRSIKMATSFLYGNDIQNDIQICFDYEGLPSEIQDHVFLERFGKDTRSGIQFDEVLMYVRFPIVSVERTGRRAPKPRALGRQDMEFFFDWLYNKGVRRILKVEVDDSGKIPHSDEAIQNSLEKIVVEHLDWQKTDLDPRVICQISSKAEAVDSDTSHESVLPRTNNGLREVTLKWSGNNAILRAWSELEGLPQLPKLEVVNLNVPAHSDLYETREWVQKNVDEFKVRLNRNANESRNAGILPKLLDPNDSQSSETLSEKKMGLTRNEPPKEGKIIVFPREGKKGTEMPVSSGSLSKTVGTTNPVTEHEWLNCVERFAGCMDLFWKETVDLSRGLLNPDSNTDAHLLTVLQSLSKDVVVALIDDGVDSCDSGFSGRIIEGKTFDYRDAGAGQYYSSARGHGTEMARMIWKVCPMASVYSIRLKTHISPNKGQCTIDAVSAASAIEAALEKKATIISMSWTMPVPPEGSKEKQLLDSVLEKACSRNVLMFCSSSDQISETKHYPSAFRRSRFFLIGAAHDDGSAYGHAGKDNDFIFPGVNVNTSGGANLSAYLADKMASSKESTGSSIATALAAELAAMITYCFKTSELAIVTAKIQQGKDYIAGPELVQRGDVEKIAQHNVLKTAFNRIGKMDNGQFIKVWNRFQPAIRILEGEGEYETKLACIMKLCSNLIEH
ncbi:hypothetical protein CGRA01v4_14827 [Colletotrichum graminicola]|uniref:Peptidase S8/S53 domain-containing protein n=1 Tax=Colletotrichum graminicola (strain M1.001 / M2 / FGSC 10212) TaxID=645133 RepID=E3QFB3_COLGM|nr:uncharacterized protein GLRG_04695 [Colletotrichum graminicola M1.001]EFQ29551.1 hypothetical protein GLRG_04695 [Colletotrichum graminicola M1.001]WDK23535.1 hypothetical protein CGRA01v4_14827 [Colletotrichum graminicola]